MNEEMSPRKILFSLSALMLAFCLSQYFQAGQSVQIRNWDQYKNLDRGSENLSNLNDPLETFNQKITPLKLEEIILQISEKNRLAGRKTRVMELEHGDGQLLMRLKQKFPQVEFYGINKEKTHSFYRRESYIQTALKYNILTAFELKNLELPYAIFQDLDFAGPIPYQDERFDLIYSQNMLSEIKYKFELLNEVLRVLKIGGLSLHTDISGLTVYRKGEVLELREAFLQFRRQGLDVSLLDNPSSIRLKKTEKKDTFPVSPHRPIPANLELVPAKIRRPEMGYNLIVP